MTGQQKNICTDSSESTVTPQLRAVTIQSQATFCAAATHTLVSVNFRAYIRAMWGRKNAPPLGWRHKHLIHNGNNASVIIIRGPRGPRRFDRMCQRAFVMSLSAQTIPTPYPPPENSSESLRPSFACERCVTLGGHVRRSLQLKLLRTDSFWHKFPIVAI